MSEHEHGPRPGHAADEAQERPRIKVTDKRRVRPDGDAGAASTEGAAPRPPVVDAGPGAGPVVGVAEPVDATETELARARGEAAEYLDRLQRMAADFANARKRMMKDQTRAVEMASEAIVARLLEVLDEFQLALMAAEQKPDFDRFLHGVELVYAKLLDILRAEGLEKIDAKGKPFDPMRHEALMQSGHGDGEPVVADVLREGYTLKGRVLRPAGVKVARDRGATDTG
jgi:molecular chaperone GrpE